MKIYKNSSADYIPDDDKYDLYMDANNTVTLVAQWEPVKYTITIKDDVLQTNDKAKVRIDKVAFNETYIFPSTNSLGESFDNKIGYQLVGFAKNRNETKDENIKKII